MMSREQECLLRTIQVASFAVVDAQLFLDTHPDCEEALEYYKNAAKVRREAYEKYEETYGPLNIYNVNDDCWTWNKSAWPWEGGNC